MLNLRNKYYSDVEYQATKKLNAVQSNFAGRLKEVRGQLKQREFAQRIGFTASYICRLEKGENTNPSAEFVAAVCREFGVSPAWLQHGTGAKDGCVALNKAVEDGVPVQMLRGERVHYRVGDTEARDEVEVEFSVEDNLNNVDFLIGQLEAAEGAQRKLLLYNLRSQVADLREKILGSGKKN